MELEQVPVGAEKARHQHHARAVAARDAAAVEDGGRPEREPVEAGQALAPDGHGGRPLIRRDSSAADEESCDDAEETAVAPSCTWAMTERSFVPISFIADNACPVSSSVVTLMSMRRSPAANVRVTRTTSLNEPVRSFAK